MSAVAGASDSTTGRRLVDAEGLSKTYGANRVLDSVDISIDAGEVVGLIGANGAGKSTLIKCLTGAVAADEGTIRLDGEAVTIHSPDDALHLGLAAVPQEVNLVEDHSVSENIMLGRFPATFGFVSERRMRRRTAELLARVQLEDVDPRLPAGKLTPTAKRLVMVAAVLARDPRLIILDEPTAALPPEESEIVARLVRRLSDDGVAVIYVSHRLHEVEDLCSRVVALRNGRLSGTLAGADINRSQMLNLIGGKGVESSSTMALAGVRPGSRASSAGETLLEARAVSGKRIRDVSFEARRGEVLGIAGLAGSGRSELLRLIYGIQAVSSGAFYYKGEKLPSGLRSRVQRRMGYVAELRSSNLLRGLSVSRNITCNSVGSHRRFGLFADRRWEKEATAEIAEQVSLVGKPDMAIEFLSGGNQQKVLISRWLVRDTELLLLDEPTAGVDLVARAEIHQLLRQLTELGKTVIVASVEADELTTICDRVLVLVEGEIRAQMESSFTEDELVTSLFSHRTVAEPQVG